MKQANRLRRPAFDREAGVAIAQALFHEHGYDAVSIANLTEALNIKPPSFYAAYGSKVGLYERSLERYARESALPLNKLLSTNKNVAKGVEGLLVAAARQYGRHKHQRGCLVTEGMRADDKDAREVACKLARPGITAINDWLKAVYPESADCLTDFIVVTLKGLSAAAYQGMPQRRLVETAKLAAHVVATHINT
ncbi:TetR/AcrR family transcriptional regulator [Rahnella sp. C60]|jgi:Transcriptional regulator|uniref:TetR/AcrR family transcriptional regulator n=1 Tax=Yersiniaceae TaxID=1903411 RepID=UPI001C262725|nr:MULTISPECIES: TetR/AcrR family transcriptional regulator [Rahnella]MBU9815629.1 TetR/AcrR family transcriptional regulator [Rahnella perminowiae]MBU9849660.1 TetR/AcrR family transcriptional regulator [Rahnella aceris]MBU9860214.1 TetR/AcrR family transcriptional regulator [Rahnella aceris]